MSKNSENREISHVTLHSKCIATRHLSTKALLLIPSDGQDSSKGMYC